MSNLAHKIQEIQTKSVYSYVKSFLDSVSLESENTRNTYQIAISDFFGFVKGKDIRFLQETDLNINLLDVEQYQAHLLRKYKRSTVNVKITAVRMLFEKLENYGFDVNKNVFNVKKVKEHDVEHYGSLTWREINQIVDFLSTQNNGLQKQLLVKLAFSTAFRKDSLLSLTWNDFTVKEGFVIVECVGKGNILDTKKITLELYNELVQLKAENSTDNDTVFSLSSSGVQRMMNNINNEFNFGKRHITFHSFKKSSIEEVARLTNYDLKAMQRQGNHASVTTTLNSYMKNKDLDDLVVVDTNIKNNENMYIFDLTNTQIYDIINLMTEKEQKVFKKIAIEKGFVNV